MTERYNSGEAMTSATAGPATLAGLALTIAVVVTMAAGRCVSHNIIGGPSAPHPARRSPMDDRNYYRMLDDEDLIDMAREGKNELAVVLGERLLAATKENEAKQDH